jgi:hypothetical protein
MSPQEAYNELALYTLSHHDKAFIHQYIVDAYAAQNADEKTKPITLAFALIGLYLHLEKNYSGREVQLAHMKLAREKREWPKFDSPTDRDIITVFDVLKTKEGKERDEMIDKWSVSVWNSWSGNRKKIESILQAEL